MKREGCLLFCSAVGGCGGFHASPGWWHHYQEDVADVAFDVTAGEELYMPECRGCHGPTAKGVSSYPKLVGQPAEYLVERLERYRAGEKIGPNTMLMAPRAKNLSDQDIGNVVAFIKSLE